MKFSLSLVALVAAALAAEGTPVPQNKNLGSDGVNQNCNGDQVIRDSQNSESSGGLLSGILSKRQNKNLGSDNVNQNACGGDQVVRDSQNSEESDGLVSGLLDKIVKRHEKHAPVPVYYAPVANNNKNLGGDGNNQNTGGDQVVRDSQSSSESSGLLGDLDLGGLLKRSSGGGYYYFPTVNDNQNLGGDANNQNAGGDQVVRDSQNSASDSGLLGDLDLGGLLKKRGGFYYSPTVNDNENLGGDRNNQNAGGAQVVRDSQNDAEDGGLLSGLLGKRGGYYYFPTANNNRNLGGDRNNQNAGGSQVTRDSQNDVQDSGLLGGLLGKRNGYYYVPTVNDNENLGGDKNNQNAGGDQVVRDSANDAQSGGLLDGLDLGSLLKRDGGFYFVPKINDNVNQGGDGNNQNEGGSQVVRDGQNVEVDDGLLSGLLGKRGGYYYFPTANVNDNQGGDRNNQNAGGAQVVRDSQNDAEDGGLLSGLLGRA